MKISKQTVNIIAEQLALDAGLKNSASRFIPMVYKVLYALQKLNFEIEIINDSEDNANAVRTNGGTSS